MSDHIEIDGTITKSRYHNGLLEMVIDGQIHSLDLWNIKDCRILAGLLEGMRIKAEAPIDHDGIVGNFIAAERIERVWGPSLIEQKLISTEPIRVIGFMPYGDRLACIIKRLLNDEERIMWWPKGVRGASGDRYDAAIDDGNQLVLVRKVDGYRPLNDQAARLRETGQ